MARATARYVAPVSSISKPSRWASALAALLLPEPAGPSIVIIMSWDGGRHNGIDSSVPCSTGSNCSGPIHHINPQYTKSEGSGRYANVGSLIRKYFKGLPVHHYVHGRGVLIAHLQSSQSGRRHRGIATAGAQRRRHGRATRSA